MSYSNSDRAGSVDDMKNAYGYAFTLGSGMLSSLMVLGQVINTCWEVFMCI